VEGVMDFLDGMRDTIALYFQTNTELALWVTIVAIAAVFLVVMLISPAFRRFMTLVLVISAVLIVLLINFGQEVARGL
jgi:high-affinity K+ transport system ATPase subunit B